MSDETEKPKKPPLTAPEAQGTFDYEETFKLLSQTRHYLSRARIDYRLARAGCGPRERGPGGGNHPKQKAAQTDRFAKEVTYFEAQVAELLNLVAEAKGSPVGLKGPADFETEEGTEP